MHEVQGARQLKQVLPEMTTKTAQTKPNKQINEEIHKNIMQWRAHAQLAES